ncbi:MAG: NAD(P)/FAD-dependent oxidoreductase [Nitrososphaerales archaeon]|nr:NAD(P)/FAD-dependent oxidoreductase [Nitrososphaerales archaeon]
MGKEKAKARITLVSRRNFHLFTPLLYQAATGLVDPDHVAQLVRPMARKHAFRFLEGELLRVDLDANIVKTSFGDLAYDYLVLAVGSENNDFGIRGVSEYAISLKTLPDAQKMHHKIIASLERALVVNDPAERRRLLTFVIIGGGATGVELAGSLKDFVKFMLRDYPGITEDESSVTLIEVMKDLLPGESGYLSEQTYRILAGRGVRVMLNSKVVEITERGILLDGGDLVETGNVFWTGGTRAPKLIDGINVEKERGRIIADEFLRIAKHPEVFAVGDLASISDFKTSQKVPATAQSAVQEGEYVGRALSRLLLGKRIEPFVYKDKGYMLSLGRQVGVAEFRHFKTAGFFGWLLWRVVHIALISTTRNRLGVIFDWTFAYFYKRNAADLES